MKDFEYGTLDMIGPVIQRLGDVRWKNGATMLKVDEFLQKYHRAIAPFVETKQKLLTEHKAKRVGNSITIDPSDPAYPKYKKAYDQAAAVEVKFETTTVVTMADLRSCKDLNLSGSDLNLLRAIEVLEDPGKKPAARKRSTAKRPTAGKTRAK